MQWVLNFLSSKYLLDIKTIVIKLTNIFKSYDDFENMKGMAKKMSLPRPFEFQKRNSRKSVNFGARRSFKMPK